MLNSDIAMHLALLVPDGVGVRNFVLGNFLKLATRHGRATVYHIIPPEHLPRYANRFDRSVTWRPLEPYAEPPAAFLLRWSLAYAQMFWADTAAMRINRNARNYGSRRSALIRESARAIGRACAGPRRIRLLDAAHCRTVAALPAVASYAQQFQADPPSVLFCTHQRPPSILPAVLAARSLAIPTATFIFSWDNLTSKGRIAAPFDHFLVWSAHMRDELLRYYPDVGPDRVHIVGTPQFDPYADPALLWSRKVFFARIGADPARPLICYSGGDRGTCPEDPDHVRVLLTLIREGRIRGNPQVLVRPSPVDDGRRYAAVRHDSPELLFARPDWSAGSDWSRFLPSAADVQFLANLTAHADVNVNMASTMTLDFAIHDKPVVNIGFDIASPPPLGKPVWDLYYRFDHYRAVVECGAARVARSPEELAAHVSAFLQDPALDRAGRQQLIRMQVGIPAGQSCGAILEVLAGIARQPPAGHNSSSCT